MPFYPGLSMLGRHFTVRKLHLDEVTRQYTTCNIMNVEVQQELLKFLNTEVKRRMANSMDESEWEAETKSANSHLTHNFKNLIKLMQPNPQREMMFVIKDYNFGLTKMLFSKDKSYRYEVKGPLGENLGVEKEGLHIGFTAGTGVLPLMDLVGHILFKRLGLNERLGVKPGDEVGENFKFKLYVSFRNREEQVALEFLEACWKYF
jgi:hypothetical protein